LARLVWLTEDEGDEISNSLRRWLDGDDLAKIEIALAFDELWLWQTRDEMDATLAAVVHPCRCRSALSRNAQAMRAIAQSLANAIY